MLHSSGGRGIQLERLGVGEGDVLKPLPKGSPICGLGIQVMDPLGRLLEEAGSFRKAALIISNICSLLELKSKNEPLSLDEDKELLSLTDNFHITSTLWQKSENTRRGRGLDQFRVELDRLRVPTYEGEAFNKQMRDQDEDSDVEEKKPDKVEVEDGSEELAELLQKLHVTK
jgi:hypothetical protein